MVLNFLTNSGYLDQQALSKNKYQDFFNHRTTQRLSVLLLERRHKFFGKLGWAEQVKSHWENLIAVTVYKYTKVGEE